jgi:hypothetical protein
VNALEFNEKYLMGRPVETITGENDFSWSYISPVCIPRIFCKDGFNVSLQTGKSLYCTPREDNGPWFQVELGFPTSGDTRLTEYMDFYSSDENEIPDPSNHVYGFVPLDIVLEVFEDHGGIDEDATKHWSEDNDNHPALV